MAYCFSDNCGDFAVTPVLVVPGRREKCCERASISYPSLPPCPKGHVLHCCEKRPRDATQERREVHDCSYCSSERPRPESPLKQCAPQYCCPTCNQPTCQPVKTKYVIPCYRYEDGRIERYMPTRHGKLPLSAYRRNGIQDQIHGYRGAIRFLCASGKNEPCSVYTAVEPIRRLYPKITQEVLPVKKRKEKKL